MLLRDATISGTRALIVEETMPSTSSAVIPCCKDVEVFVFCVSVLLLLIGAETLLAAGSIELIPERAAA